MVNLIIKICKIIIFKNNNNKLYLIKNYTKYFQYNNFLNNFYLIVTKKIKNFYFKT